MNVGIDLGAEFLAQLTASRIWFDGDDVSPLMTSVDDCPQTHRAQAGYKKGVAELQRQATQRAKRCA